MLRQVAACSLLIAMTACGEVVGRDAGPDGPGADDPDAAGEPADPDAGGQPDASSDAGGPDADVDKLVFVTSRSFTGAMDGLVGADKLCQDAAVAAGLPGEYMAWLSDSVGNGPSTRMRQSKVPYRLTTGAVVARDWDDLVDGDIDTTINIDELGNPSQGGDFICQGGEVWTNTTTEGNPRRSACGDWTSTDGTAALVGNLGFDDQQWTESAECGEVICQSVLPLYCFEQ